MMTKGGLVKPQKRTSPVAIPPGYTLKDSLDSKGMTQEELSRRIDMSPKALSHIITGKAPITTDTALKLEKVFKVPARFWMQLESNYQEALKRRTFEEPSEEECAVLANIPYSELAKQAYVPVTRDQSRRVLALRDLFGVANLTLIPDVFVPVFRKCETKSANQYALAAWARIGEIKAEEIECGKFNAEKLRRLLPVFRDLTRSQPEVFYPKLVELCASCGVALVLNPHIKGLGTNGATVWNSKKTMATVMLTVRGKRADVFWFTFFHELSHVINGDKEDHFEDHADEDAAEALIPTELYKRLIDRGDFTYGSIKQFAEQIGIHEAIVIGRLQHDQKVSYQSPLTRCIPKFEITLH